VGQAGVAVGSVFTTFASKGEILSEVMQGRLAPLYAEIDRVTPHIHGSTVDRLRTMFSVHFEFEARQARLFLAHIAAAYDWTLTSGAMPYGRNAHFRRVRGVLARGVAGRRGPTSTPGGRRPAGGSPCLDLAAEDHRGRRRQGHDRRHGPPDRSSPPASRRGQFAPSSSRRAITCA
jgi:AcrR family transcriptional regulator